MPWLFGLLLFWMAPLWAAPLPSCETPQDAALTLLSLLPPNGDQPQQADDCLNVPDGMEGRRTQLAVQLKAVLDARGYYIDVDGLPDEPGYAPEDSSGVIRLVDALPSVYLEKVGDQWLWSEETVRAVPGLHRETFRGLGSWLQEHLPPVFTTLSLAGFFLWQAVLLVGLLGAGWLASVLISGLMRSQLTAWVHRLGVPLDLAVLKRTRRPMTWLIVGAVLLWGAPELQLGINPLRALLFLARALMSVAAVLIAMRWLDVFMGIFKEHTAKTQSRMDDQVVPLLHQTARLAIVILGLVFILQNVGVDVASLVAGLGIGGLALALAAQDTLANVFGSLMIFIDRPFHVGDPIVLGDGTEGSVEQVGFRSTRIRTFYNSVISVPNSKVANGRVDNLGLREYRRFKTTLGITYDTPPDVVQAFVEGLRAILAAHPDTRKDAYEVHLQGFGDSALEILVYAFFKVPDWHSELRARSQVLLEFLRLAEALGVSFAFPSQSLYVETTPERPLPRRDVPSLEELRALVDAFGPEGSRSRPGGPVISQGYKAGADSERGDSAE